MSLTNYNETSVIFKGFIVKKTTLNKVTNTYEVFLSLPRKQHTCPRCQQTTDKIKDYRQQQIKDINILNYQTIIVLLKRRYICSHCGKCFAEENHLIAKYQRNTLRLEQSIINECNLLQSFSQIAKRFNLSVTTIIRKFNIISYSLPKLPECISIDEFKGNADNEKFQCNLTNPITHKILDILPSRNTEKLYKYFLQFSRKERLKVNLVVMDLSSLFRSVITNVFPNAEIVADKFHVIRLVVWAMEKVRKRIQKQFHKEKRRWCKRSKYLLTTPDYKLNADEKLELNRILISSEELSTAYALKEYFYKIFQARNKAAAINQLSNWLMLAGKSQLNEFKSCITTFTRWSNEIVNVIEKKVTNAFTEGIHNKIKVLKRISFGVRNFNRFRNRILYICA